MSSSNPEMKITYATMSADQMETLHRGIDEAIEHIQKHGTGHTDVIISEDKNSQDYFINQLDSAILMINASSQFADGGEFGMGGEIGIATGKFHARGPVSLEQLTSFKYVVRGSGQTRS